MDEFVNNGVGKNKIKFVNKRNSLQNQQLTMHNRHTTEIRQLLQKKRLSKSRFNPESRVVITSSSMKQSRQIKKSSSSSSFHTDKQKQLQLQVMQKRYQELYYEYEKMLQEARKKADMCKRQQEEIYKYEKAGQRDRVQIERLKSMVGMISKKDNAVQTIQNKDNFINKQYKFVEEFTRKQARKTSSQSKLRQSRSSKDISIANSNNKINRLISQNNQNHHQYPTLNNPKMVNSTLVNPSRDSFKKRNSLGCEELQNNQQSQLNSKKQMSKKYEHSRVNQSKINDYSKMAQSLLYGNKSSVDFRKKKQHLSKGSIGQNEEQPQQSYNKTQLNTQLNPPKVHTNNSRVNNNGDHLRLNQPKTRVNSPNSRFKFIPSVDI